MNRSRIVVRLVLIVLGIVFATHVWAYPQFARTTKVACVTCHANPAGGADLSDLGKAYKADASKAPAAAETKAAEYVGVTKCRMCHIKQHKAWLDTPHAKAWAALTSGDAKKTADMAAALKVEIKGSPSKTDECVACHVVGFQLAGGYPQSDSTKTAALINVGCEACHGPGSLHASAPMAEKKKLINRAVGENLCKQCHTPVTSPNFAFAEYKKKGVHQVPAQ